MNFNSLGKNTQTIMYWYYNIDNACIHSNARFVSLLMLQNVNLLSIIIISCLILMLNMFSKYKHRKK